MRFSDTMEWYLLSSFITACVLASVLVLLLLLCLSREVNSDAGHSDTEQGAGASYHSLESAKEPCKMHTRGERGESSQAQTCTVVKEDDDDDYASLHQYDLVPTEEEREKIVVGSVVYDVPRPQKENYTYDVPRSHKEVPDYENLDVVCPPSPQLASNQRETSPDANSSAPLYLNVTYQRTPSPSLDPPRVTTSPEANSSVPLYRNVTYQRTPSPSLVPPRVTTPVPSLSNTHSSPVPLIQQT